jgi:hypothetical protein
MKTVIFTPTRLAGGLDVTYSGLLRQTVKDDLIWVIGDDLFKQRSGVVIDHTRSGPIPVIQFDGAFARRERPELHSTLEACYNAAIEIALAEGAELLLSLQDYIWIQDDGVERFQKVQQEVQGRGDKGLYTGLTSVCSDPDKAFVKDKEALWSIFAEEYKDKPQHIAWHDVRDIAPGELMHIDDPVWWELNWAGIGAEALHDESLRFDEDYGLGVAYGNQDYAMNAYKNGYGIYLDTGNHALSLPHKEYYKEVETAELPLNNVDRHTAKWGL